MVQKSKFFEKRVGGLRRRARSSASSFDLAAEAGMRQALVSAIEVGAANPTLASLEKLAATLGVTFAELFGH
jgi:transcriptional regulator with XRE-family HTH domain